MEEDHLGITKIFIGNMTYVHLKMFGNTLQKTDGINQAILRKYLMKYQ